MKADLVLVEWLDAHAEAAWYTVESVLEDHKPATAFDVGWMLKRDKVGVSLFCSFVSVSNEVGRVAFIPACMIKKITVLKKAKRRTS